MSLLNKLKDPAAYKGSVTSLLGDLPKGALVDASTPSINDTFSNGRYQDYVLDTERATDITGEAQETQQ